MRHTLHRVLASVMLALVPPGVLPVQTSPPTPPDPAPTHAVNPPTLDPQARALLDQIAAETAKHPEPAPKSPAEAFAAARAAYRATIPLAGPPVNLLAIVDRVIPGPDGTTLTIRVYTPDAGLAARPSLVFLHGGGFTAGDLDTHDLPLRSLAAAVAQMTRARGGPRLAFQLLIYPDTDVRESIFTDYPSWTVNDGRILNQQAKRRDLDAYLPPGTDRSDPRASPLCASSLAGQPPALVVTDEGDPQRDEGEAYAHALEAAGVPVTLTRYPGMIHGFFQMAGKLDAGARLITECAAALRRAFGPQP